MKTTFIYALCEPGTRTVRYIGKADEPQKRFQKHLAISSKLKTHIGNWLRLLASKGEKPEMIVLREVPYDQWQVAEERYIRLARGCGINLVNSTDGGEGVTMTPEIRAKISAGNTGTVMSLETRAKMSKAKSGRTLSPTTRKRIGDAQRGEKGNNFRKTMPDEIKARISASLSGDKNHNFGRSPSPETCAKTSATLKGLYKTGELKPRSGWKHLPETLEKMSGPREVTPESHARMSEVAKQRMTPEVRMKISLALRGEKSPKFGIKVSEESRARMSEAQKIRWAKERARKTT